MRRLMIVLAVVVLAGAAAASAQKAADLESLFANAQRHETIDADLAGAISLYTQVITTAGPTHALTPRAMLRLAECHRKLGHADARRIYSDIVRDYPQSGEPYDTALVRLAVMQSSSGDLQASTFTLPDEYSTNWEVSPDGRSLVWLRRAGSQQAPDSDLVIRDLATGAERVLAAHLRGISAHIGFSPDGSRVAAAIGSGGPANTRPYRQLVAVGLQPGGAQPLTIETRASFEDARPKWSPDGRWLPYLGPSSDPALSEVRLLNVQTGETSSLDAAVIGRPEFVWMPGDGRLAFRVADGPTVRGNRAFAVDVAISPGVIHLVRLDNRAHEVVEPPAEMQRSMRLVSATADGRLVLQRADATTPGRRPGPGVVTVGLFDPTSRRFAITCEGEPLRAFQRLGEDGSRDQCLEVTPDGASQLFWSAATKQLMVRNIASGDERPLTVGGAEEHFGMLSSDGRVQAFISNRDGQWGLYAAAIDRAPVAEPLRLGDLNGLPTRVLPHWTDRGLVLGTQGGSLNVFRVDMNPLTGRSIGPVVRLTQDNQWNDFPSISPDGTRIAYWVTQGQSGLAVMNADGSNERLTTPRQFGYARYLTWLSNTSVLLTSTLPDSQGPQRLAIDTRSGVVSPVAVPLFQNPAGDNPASNWDLRQPSGEVIYAWAEAARGPFEFRARSATSGAERTVARLSVTGCALDNFVVAPDGGMLAYQLGPCDETRAPLIGVANLETGATEVVIEPAGPAYIGGLSSGGRYLAYSMTGAMDDIRPYIMDLTTRETWPLMAEAQQPAMYYPLMKWAPDGSYLVFVQGGQRREWKHWTNVSYEAVTAGADSGAARR
jgi:Tol biopolymer transport system component